MIHIWIVDIYHVEIHRSLKDSPINVWRKSAQRFVAPRLPESVDVINQMLWEKSTRRLQKYGIDLFALKYNSESLMSLASRVAARGHPSRTDHPESALGIRSSRGVRRSIRRHAGAATKYWRKSDTRPLARLWERRPAGYNSVD